MGIKKIIFEGHEVLSDNGNNPWIPNQSLNIITSKNGGGKTKLLEYIGKRYHRPNASNEPCSIKSLSTSVKDFKCYPTDKTEEYAPTGRIKNAKPVTVRQFKDEYTVISMLPKNPSLVAECNDFLSELNLQIRLDSQFVTKGRLLFEQQNNKATLSLNEISTGEKTAFILWLLIKSENKPNVLILDEFDAHLNRYEYKSANGDDVSIFISLYRVIFENFIKSGIQVFFATNRSIPNDITKYYNKDQITEWQIKEGTIQPK